jgi:uncharacterized phiE125 gp8 family phage protein
MERGLILTTAPAEEPITRDEAKLHLKIDVSPPTAHDDDSIVDRLIKIARRWCEHFQNRAYITQTWTLYLDEFPVGNYVEIPLSPLRCVNSIVYLDSSGTTQTVSFLDPSGTAQLETDDYLVDIAREPGRLYLKYSKSWPTTLAQAQAITVEFDSGYGAAADVPEEEQAAMLATIEHLYDHRGDETNLELPVVAKALLWPNRIVPI